MGERLGTDVERGSVARRSNMNRRTHWLVPALFIGLACASAGAQQKKPSAEPAGTAKSGSQAATTRDVKDGRAVAALKEMSDTLAKAQGMSFRADTAVAIASPTNQWVKVFGVSQVTLRRPDQLYVETGGDMFTQVFYYDGKTVSMYAPAEKLYATEQIQRGLDEALLQVFEKHGTYFSFADVLLSVPQREMVKDLTNAQLVGESKGVGGVATTHLAFAKPGMEWEIWIGADDHLPRRLDVTYTDVEGRPTGSVAFSDWKINPSIAPDRFVFTPPSGATRIEFARLESPAKH